MSQYHSYDGYLTSANADRRVAVTMGGPPVYPGVDGISAAGGGGPLDYGRAFRRRKGLLLICAVLGGAVGYLIAMPQAPVYRARASIEISDINPSYSPERQISDLAQPYNALPDIQTQIRILESEQLSDRQPWASHLHFLCKCRAADQPSRHLYGLRLLC